MSSPFNCMVSFILPLVLLLQNSYARQCGLTVDEQTCVDYINRGFCTKWDDSSANNWCVCNSYACSGGYAADEEDVTTTAESQDGLSKAEMIAAIGGGIWLCCFAGILWFVSCKKETTKSTTFPRVDAMDKGRLSIVEEKEREYDMTRFTDNVMENDAQDIVVEMPAQLTFSETKECLERHQRLQSN